MPQAETTTTTVDSNIHWDD